MKSKYQVNVGKLFTKAMGVFEKLDKFLTRNILAEPLAAMPLICETSELFI